MHFIICILFLSIYTDDDEKLNIFSHHIAKKIKCNKFNNDNDYLDDFSLTSLK